MLEHHYIVTAQGEQSVSFVACQRVIKHFHHRSASTGAKLALEFEARAQKMFSSLMEPPVLMSIFDCGVDEDEDARSDQ